MRKDFYAFLTNLFVADPRVSILLGDIGVFSMKRCFDHDASRMYNMGILEQTMIGVASGLADSGFVPFVHSIAPFVTERCYEQLKIDLGYESKNVFVVTVGNSYDYASLGCTHHCPNDLNIMRSIPNFRVYCPGNSHDVQKIITDNLHTPYPKYIRLSETANTLPTSAPLDDFMVLKRGSRGVVIVVGNAVTDITRLIRDTGDVSILYLVNVSHVPTQSLTTFIEQHSVTPRICVVEPSYEAGIVGKIALAVQPLEKIQSIAVPPVFIDKYGKKDEIDRYLCLDDSSIISRINRMYA